MGRHVIWPLRARLGDKLSSEVSFETPIGDTTAVGPGILPLLTLYLVVAGHVVSDDAVLAGFASGRRPQWKDLGGMGALFHVLGPSVTTRPMANWRSSRDLARARDLAGKQRKSFPGNRAGPPLEITPCQK